MATGTPRPSQSPATWVESVNPVRAVLMLTMVAEPPSTSRVTSAAVGALSSAT